MKKISRRHFMDGLVASGAFLGLNLVTGCAGHDSIGKPYKFLENKQGWPLSDHPVLGRGTMEGRDFYHISPRLGPHDGIDWAGPIGEPIFHLLGFNPSIIKGQYVSRGDIIGFLGDTGKGIGGTPSQNIPHLHYGFGVFPLGHPQYMRFDPMLYGILQPFVPLYDFKSKLDILPSERPRALEELKDTLDAKLMDYDGPEREQLKKFRHDTRQMKRLLYTHTVETTRHIPGSPVYTVMLETFVYTAPESKPVLLTHPLMDPKNRIYTKKYEEVETIFLK